MSSAAASKPAPPSNGKDLELLFFGNNPTQTVNASPFLHEYGKLNVKKERIVFEARDNTSLTKISENRTFWVPLKQQLKTPRLPLVFNQFATQFRLACHRLCVLLFNKIPRPSDLTEDTVLAAHCVSQSLIYCAVHGFAFAYASKLNDYSTPSLQYLTTCIKILTSGYPASSDEFLSLASAEFRMLQNLDSPVDDLMSKLIKPAITLPINYRASCWFHSACAFLLPASRSAFDFLRRNELEAVYIENAAQENRNVSTFVSAFTSLVYTPMHHATLPITETLIRLIYEAMRIICERRSTPMYNLIEIVANLDAVKLQDFGIVLLERNLVDATDTAFNLISPFTFPWKLAPSKSAKNLLLDSQNYADEGTLARGLEERLIPSMGAGSELRKCTKIYSPLSLPNLTSAKILRRGSIDNGLKGNDTVEVPYVAIRVWENYRVILSIKNAGFPPRICFFLGRKDGMPVGVIDTDNLFSHIFKAYGSIEINSATRYALASCVLYSPGHYKMRYRDATTGIWYQYDDLGARINEVDLSNSNPECSIIMLVRTSPGVSFNYNLLTPAASKKTPPAPSPTFSSRVFSIVRYGGIGIDSVKRCRYILGTNGLVVNSTFANIDYQTAVQGMKKETLVRSMSEYKNTHVIVCTNSTNDIPALFEIATDLKDRENRMTIMYCIPENTVLTQAESKQIETLASFLAVMIIPDHTRDVCAFNQQVCSVLKTEYRTIPYLPFINYMWNVYSSESIRHQKFLPNFTVPSQPVIYHRWTPYIENGYYLLICHKDRMAYLRGDPVVSDLFSGDTVEVWGSDSVDHLDSLDIPFASKWIIYESKYNYYMAPMTLDRIKSMLSEAKCKVRTIVVE
jgi:hypothetical protein